MADEESSNLHSNKLSAEESSDEDLSDGGSFAEYDSDALAFYINDITQSLLEELSISNHSREDNADNESATSFDDSGSVSTFLYDDSDNINDGSGELGRIHEVPTPTVPISPTKKEKKHIRFGHVTIREYAVTVGALTALDTDICPIQLSWEHSRDKTLPISPSCREDASPAEVRKLTSSERLERIATVQGHKQILTKDFTSMPLFIAMPRPTIKNQKSGTSRMA